MRNGAQRKGAAGSRKTPQAPEPPRPSRTSSRGATAANTGRQPRERGHEPSGPLHWAWTRDDRNQDGKLALSTALFVALDNEYTGCGGHTRVPGPSRGQSQLGAAAWTLGEAPAPRGRQTPPTLRPAVSCDGSHSVVGDG